MNITHKSTSTSGPKENLRDAKFMGSVESKAHDTIRYDTRDRRDVTRGVKFMKEVFKGRETSSTCRFTE